MSIPNIDGKEAAARDAFDEARRSTLTPHQVWDIAAGTEGVQGGPWKLDKFACYIWAPSEKGGDFPLMDELGENGRVAEMRGWGHYTGRGEGGLRLSEADATQRQRLTGEHIARLSPEIVAQLCAGWLRDNERQGEESKLREEGGATSRAILDLITDFRKRAPFGYHEPGSPYPSHRMLILRSNDIERLLDRLLDAAIAAEKGERASEALTAAHAAGEREDDRRRMDRLSDPGQQGRAAALDNAALAENPYLTDTPAWWAWLEGYRSERDAMTACALVPNGEEDGR